ncbi:MAG: nucleotide exchange factor GrpE [Ignavibacteriaceae bacterium]|nr:MAG: nucleotide exchange factor GrpE [Chlorobiota bacterium]GJQ33430.1 MAG: nucleotide exchange factor GrpE [Ignavibacteriaceae bacterium]
MKFSRKNRKMDETQEMKEKETQETTETMNEEPVTETKAVPEVDPMVSVLTAENDALKAEVEKYKAEVDSLRDILQRRMAEIDNIKRRHREESLKAWTDAEGSLITALLPVIDNFDRAAEFAPKTEDKTKVIDGFILIHDQFNKLLENKGLQKIEAKGQPFDYNLHNAIGRMVNAELEPDTVLEEVRTGYIYKDSILRHSDVIISEKPEE